MRDNNETNPSIIEARFRAGDDQATLNIELGLSDSSASESNSSSTSGLSQNVVISSITSGTSGTGLPKDVPEIVE